MTNQSAVELSRQLREGDVTSTELVTRCFDAIDQTDSQVNAYITLLKSSALESAAKIDERFSKGETLSPLAGIPIAIKDNICMANVRTTCASKMLHFTQR